MCAAPSDGGAYFFGVQMSRTEEDEKRLGSRREKVTALLVSLGARLDTDQGKASVTDYVRLMQFERELEEEQPPRELKVTWSEPLETYDIDE